MVKIKEKLTWSGLLATVSMLIALGALFVSGLSYRMNRATFEAKQKGVFIGVLDETGTSLTLDPMKTDDVKLLGADMIFPRELDIGMLSIIPPHFKLPVGPIKEALQRKKPFAGQEAGGRFLVPVLLKTSYVAQSEYHSSSSIYIIIVGFGVPRSRDETQPVDVLGLVFRNAVERDDEIARLEKAWVEAKSVGAFSTGPS